MELDLITLFRGLANEVGLDPYTISYCCRRINSEGIQFLTVTLPKLSKAVLRSLELGSFDRSDLTCFAWKGKSLRYFSKFLFKIFDKDGYVLPEPDAYAIYCIRQLCDYFYKLALPYSETQVKDAEEKFLSEDNSLDMSKVDPSLCERIRKDFEHNFSDIMKDTEADVLRQFPPRPGTGSYSGRPRLWFLRKYTDGEYHPSYEAHKGAFRYMARRRLSANANDPDYSEVLFVNKDSRGPRTIVREPFLRLKGQLSFFDYMVDRLEYITHGRIMFHDQSQNRQLARASSIDKAMCTIDLRSASDRVSYAAMLRIFRNCPVIRAFLCKFRTTTVKLPSGRFHTLNKVSGMGSGLTFPLMALAIYLVSVRSVADCYRISWQRASKLCYTYGDDLLAPNGAYQHIRSNLGKLLLDVNDDKSYTRSHFRESCGGDYFNGQDVTPVRLKLSSCDLKAIGRTLYVSGSFGLLSLERHCRELVGAGLLSVSEYIYARIERSYGPLPLVSGDSPVIGRYSLSRDAVIDTLEVDDTGAYKLEKALVPVPKKHMDSNYDVLSRIGLSLRSRAFHDTVLQRFNALAHLNSESVQLSDPSVTVPRMIAVRRTKQSSFIRAGMPDVGAAS